MVLNFNTIFRELYGHVLLLIVLFKMLMTAKKVGVGRVYVCVCVCVGVIFRNSRSNTVKKCFLRFFTLDM